MTTAGSSAPAPAPLRSAAPALALALAPAPAGAAPAPQVRATTCPTRLRAFATLIALGLLMTSGPRAFAKKKRHVPAAASSGQVTPHAGAILRKRGAAPPAGAGVGVPVAGRTARARRHGGGVGGGARPATDAPGARTGGEPIAPDDPVTLAASGAGAAAAGARADEPGTEGAATVPAAAPGAKPVKTKVYTFGAMDVEGKLKTPQLLYFLNRIKLELEMSASDQRSFMKELARTADDPNL